MLQPIPNETEQQTQPEPRQESVPAPAVLIDAGWRAGRKLAEARLRRGWSLDEVAERIRVRREFLEALEDMNMKLLPGRAYALAFLRSYVRELGLDENAIVEQFQEESALTREDASKQIRTPASKPRRDRPWMLAAVLVALSAGFVVWRAVQRTDEPAAVTEAVGPDGSNVAAAARDILGEEARVVEIRALAEAQLEARGPDGTVFFYRTLQPGDVYRPDPSPGWTLHARDGGAFELYVNGAPAGLLGTAGMPVLGRPIDNVQPLTQAQLAPPNS